MNVIGLGAGGHARVVVEILQLCGEHRLVGLLDSNPARHGAKVLGVEVLGGDEQLQELRRAGIEGAVLAVGAVGDPKPRLRLAERLRELGFTMVSAVHPKSIVSPAAAIGEGATIMAGAIVNPGAQVGRDVILNTGVVVEHDCIVEPQAHLASGVKLGGGAFVGEAAFLGLGATVLPGVKIGARAILGAGAVCVHNVPDYCVAVGVPARIIRTLTP